jgi:SnoaL-like domain
VEPREPDQVVREMLEAFRRGDYESALSAYSPEGEYDFTHVADGSLVRSRDGVRSEVGRWVAIWESLTFEYEVIGVAGDKVVIVGMYTPVVSGPGGGSSRVYGVRSARRRRESDKAEARSNSLSRAGLLGRGPCILAR